MGNIFLTLLRFNITQSFSLQQLRSSNVGFPLTGFITICVLSAVNSTRPAYRSVWSLVCWSGFQEEAPFHHSLMTYFRKRLNKQAINQINEWIALGEHSQAQDDHDDDEPGQSTTKHLMRSSKFRCWTGVSSRSKRPGPLPFFRLPFECPLFYTTDKSGCIRLVPDLNFSPDSVCSSGMHQVFQFIKRVFCRPTTDLLSRQSQSN